MKKIFSILFIGLLLSSTVYGQMRAIPPSAPDIIRSSDCAWLTWLGTLCHDTDDGKLYKWNGAALEELTAGGLGDVTKVGDCASGDCLDGSSDGGTYLRLYDGNSHYSQFSPGDSSANLTFTFPAAYPSEAVEIMYMSNAGVIVTGAVAGLTGLNALADSFADGTVNQTGWKQIWTSTLNTAGSIWTFTNTTADLTADVSFLDFKYTDDGDSNGFFIRGYDHAGADLKFSIGADGAATLGAVTATSVSTGGSADPTITMQDTDGAAGTGKIFANSSGGAYDVIMQLGVEDSTGESTVYMELDGVTETIDLIKPVVTTSSLTVGTSLLPDAADGATIGSATAEWSDLYLADGGVIYFQNDQSVYLTPSAGTLTLTGTMAANGFSGPLTGNVTGNASGTAATVTGAAQANITSVGTLTSITTSGTITLANSETITNATDTQIAFTANGGEELILDLDTATDNEIAFTTSSGATQINFGSFNMITTGTIDGGIPVSKETDATVTVSGMSKFYVNADDDVIAFNLPADPTNKAFCFANLLYARAITVNPDDADYIVNEDATLAAGEAIISSGAKKDQLCVVGIDTGYWKVTSKVGTWAEETP